MGIERVGKRVGCFGIKDIGLYVASIYSILGG